MKAATRTASSAGAAAGSGAGAAGLAVPRSRRARPPQVRTKPLPPLPRGWQPFQLPDLVLDLDAWEAPRRRGGAVVRLFDEADERAERARWRTGTEEELGRKVTRFEMEMEWAEEKLARARAAWTKERGSSSPWAVTDFDVLAAAMVGLPGRMEDVAEEHEGTFEDMMRQREQCEPEEEEEVVRAEGEEDAASSEARDDPVSSTSSHLEPGWRPRPLPSPAVASLATVAFENGIPPRTWRDGGGNHPGSLLTWLLHRQGPEWWAAAAAPSSARALGSPRVLSFPEATSVTEAAARATRPEGKLLAAALARCTTLQEARRLTGRSMQAGAAGVRIVGEVVDEVARACSRLVPKPWSRADDADAGDEGLWDGSERSNDGGGNVWDALAFVNSVQLGLARHGLPPGEPLCRFALITSAAALRPQATLRFWHLASPTWMSAAQMRIMMTDFLGGLRDTKWSRPSGRDAPRREAARRAMMEPEGRRALFCLLTGLPGSGAFGQGGGGAAAEPAARWRRQMLGGPDERRRPERGPWRAAVSYTLYTQILAELGAYRTLAHELGAAFDGSLASDLEARPGEEEAGQDGEEATTEAEAGSSTWARYIASALRQARAATPRRFEFRPADDLERPLTWEECLEADFISVGEQEPEDPGVVRRRLTWFAPATTDAAGSSSPSSPTSSSSQGKKHAEQRETTRDDETEPEPTVKYDEYLELEESEADAAAAGALKLAIRARTAGRSSRATTKNRILAMWAVALGDASTAGQGRPAADAEPRPAP